MKASQFTDARKAFIIKRGEDGTSVAEICRKAEIDQTTFFKLEKELRRRAAVEMIRLGEIQA